MTGLSPVNCPSIQATDPLAVVLLVSQWVEAATILTRVHQECPLVRTHKDHITYDFEGVFGFFAKQANFVTKHLQTAG